MSWKSRKAGKQDKHVNEKIRDLCDQLATALSMTRQDFWPAIEMKINIQRKNPHLSRKLFHVLLKSCLVAWEISRHSGVEHQQLLGHHLHLDHEQAGNVAMPKYIMTYSIFIQKIQFYLNIRLQLLKFLFLVVKADLCFIHFQLVSLSLPSCSIILQVCPVSIIFNPGQHLSICDSSLSYLPGNFILLDSEEAVLHGLVHAGVHRAHKEVQWSQELLSILGQVSLGLSIE